MSGVVPGSIPGLAFLFSSYSAGLPSVRQAPSCTNLVLTSATGREETNLRKTPDLAWIHMVRMPHELLS